ncbi:MAG TPA: methionyl-tRNA formyltransferase [Fimbriimonadaceae bacterium]|nr:methionyl-tRNA formyltransferase [Fimbriimonadaceae bacterium]
MRIVYFGTASFAVPALRAVAPHVVLVVSQPDRPGRRGMQLQASPVKQAALDLGLPVETPEKSRVPEFVERLRSLDADVLLVAAYGQILSTAVLESAKKGGINLHGSILPKYRGAAPIQRCILAGDAETGVTLMQMDKGMDTGNMIAIERTPIGPDETYGEVQDRLAEIAAGMARAWMPRVVAGDYPRTSQNHDEATVAPKVEKAEAELSFERPAGEEYNRFRAFTPSPGAFIRTRFGLVKLSRARLGTEEGAPGVVMSTAESCQVGFGEGSLHLLELQPEGKKRMTGKDFANGLRLRVGDSLL